ncbi:DUF2471 family protein [Pandoraea pnomenusa]|uniref:DUF2471 family protein n=1 Tax=Pandoraea pnomenusa TaxID=93220 RepID=UPI00333F0F57
MEIIDWDQLALSAAERDLAGVVREIAARYAQQRLQESDAIPAHHTTDDAASAHTGARLDWRTLVAIADEAEADLGLHARHEPWVLARLLRLPGDEALRRHGDLPPLEAAVDLQWPDAPAPAVFRAIVAAFAGDDASGEDAAVLPAGSSVLAGALRAAGPSCAA